MAYTFEGGIKLPEKKKAAGKAIEIISAPERLYFPLYSGGACAAAVKDGDVVLKAQVIGEPEDDTGYPVYSSVSGKVVGVETRNGIDTVIIENDKNNTISKDVLPYEGKLSFLTTEDIIAYARRAGICEADVPAFIKIKKRRGKSGETYYKLRGERALSLRRSQAAA